jgi:hypothetical protein
MACLGFFGTLAGTFDESTEIADREVEREVDRCQQLHKEQIPSQQTYDEGKCARSSLICRLGNSMASLEEHCSEAGESRHQQREDQHKDDVRAKCNDEINKAQQAHIDMEEGESRVELRIRSRGGRVIWLIGRSSVVVRSECRAEREPEGAEGAEHHERESVAQNELEEGADDHKETAEEIIAATARS